MCAWVVYIHIFGSVVELSVCLQSCLMCAWVVYIHIFGSVVELSVCLQSCLYFVDLMGSEALVEGLTGTSLDETAAVSGLPLHTALDLHERAIQTLQ